MIGFAAKRLMELETEGICGAAHGEARRDVATNATGIVTAAGTPERAPSSSRYRNCVMAATSQASRLCGEIDGRVQAFLIRPVEGEWHYLWLDATYVKVRRDHRIV